MSQEMDFKVMYFLVSMHVQNIQFVKEDNVKMVPIIIICILVG